MSVTASALRELHRIHRQITDLRSQLARGPKQVQAGEALLQRLEKQLREAKEALMHTRVLADDRQLQLRQREDRIKDLQAKLNMCGSNREYQTLREQIAADEKANSVLADEILEALEKIDEQQATVTKTQVDHQRAARDVERLHAEVSAKRKGLESELDRVTRELQQAEKALPSDFRADYERISRARGEDALARAEDQICTGCYQMLSAQTMNDLMLCKPVFCKSCGALLYLPEDPSPK